MNRFEWAEPKAIEEAVELHVKGAAYKAGGIDLLDMMKERISEPTRLVNLKNIPGLDQLTTDQSGITMGPLVTLARLAEDPGVRKVAPAIALAAGSAATPQVRNVATAGGNLLQRPRCWYFRSELYPCRKKGGEICYAQQGENQYHAIFRNGLCAIVHPSGLATPLVAYGASVELMRGKEKRQVKLEEFFTLPNVDLHRENVLEPGEVLTVIHVPLPAPGARSAYLRQGEKQSFDWPIAEVATVIESEGSKCKSASIVLGAAAPVPLRAKVIEQALIGAELTPQNVRAAAEAALAEASPLAHNAYKIPLFKAMISRAILATQGEGK